jgi:hypothetical protein
MSHHDPGAAARPPALPWPVLPVALPFLYAWLGWGWWAETRAQIEALSAEATATGALAAASVAGRALAVLSEAACYALWWRSRRLRLPFWRFTCWVATLSALDLLGFSLRRVVEDGPEAVRVLGAALAGPAALGPAAGPPTGSVAAFGSLGLLTLARVGLTAWAQARGLGRPFAGPLTLTTIAWLLTRLIGWWSVDLVRGLSPLP